MSKNIALIGAGCWGKNLARNLFELGVLHTICDTNESLLDVCEENYPDTKLTSNYNAVLEDRSISRVVIAAPVFQHYQLAKDALNAGKDVYVEKPICIEPLEAEELQQIAQSKNLILMVGHLLQYHPCVRHLIESVQRGKLGKLQYISSNRLDLGRVRTEENALWNFAPHDISVILSLCGNISPVEVDCKGGDYVTKGVSDITVTTLTFPEDIKAHIYVSWLNPFKEQKLVVVGSSGLAVFDDMKPWKEKLLYYKGYINQEGVYPVVTKMEPEKVDIPIAEPLKEECKHFIYCCDERITPHTDGEEGIRVLKVLQRAQERLDATSIPLEV